MATITRESYDEFILATGVYTTSGNQETIHLPPMKGGYLVQLVPTGGTAKVQSSINGANWEDWSLGDVTASTTVPAKPIRYIRVVNGTSTSTSLTVWGY